MAIAYCGTCSKRFKPHRASKKGIYCSHICYWKDMVGKSTERKTRNGMQAWNKGKKLPNQSGKNHSNWKGGLRGESYLERRRFHSTMQKLIFKRDGYKCQICEATGDLQVDHIASWAEFKELRFDPENCRTLCAKCHYKITFGREMPDSVKTWGHNLGRGIGK